MTVSSIEDIEKKWIEEKTNPYLTELPEEFYSNIAGYVAELKRELNHSEELRKEILEEEIYQVLKMTQEIHFRRTLKMMEKSAKGETSQLLLEEEQRIFEEIEGELRKSYEKILLPAMEGRAELRKPQEITNTPVLISSEVEQIIGDDMRNYGPFKTGDIANLPKRTARILINHGLAKKLKIKDL
ncbi:MAG: hypothetical protein KGY45_02765 [Hadesarchaea archaeon]|nr:hypothetical protein [Hadesarchaea archaeon]